MRLSGFFVLQKVIIVSYGPKPTSCRSRQSYYESVVMEKGFTKTIGKPFGSDYMSLVASAFTSCEISDAILLSKDRARDAHRAASW